MHNAGRHGGIRLGREVARSPCDLEVFLGELVCSLDLTRRQVGEAEDAEHPRDLLVVSHPAINQQARLTKAAHRLVVALHHRQRRDPRLSLCPRHLRAGALGQQPLEVLAAFRLGSSQLPEAPERCAGPQANFCLPALGSPGQRGTDVGDLGIEPLEPAQLVWSEERGLGRFC